ncbi:MAG: hypothetical protein ACYDA8_11425 [Deferrisomatales bacterium]
MERAYEHRDRWVNRLVLGAGRQAGEPRARGLLKWGHHPIAMLGGRPGAPVFILVCKNTALANVIFAWQASGRSPVGIPPAKLDGFRNTEAATNTIVVHSKVVHETDTGAAKSDEARGDVDEGEAPELPLLEGTRGPGSTAEVDFWTSRDVREAARSHVNVVAADTKRWEQSAGYYLDTHPAVVAFVKNAGLGLGIPYLWNGEQHEYVPDFVVRLAGSTERYLLLETKGYDPLKEVKRAAAERWCAAVNAHRGFGAWGYRVADKTEAVPGIVEAYGRTGTVHPFGACSTSASHGSRGR